MQLEQHVYTIEAANINQETLLAMNQASEAMKRMHAGLTMDKVDEMMYEHPFNSIGPTDVNAIIGTKSGNSNNSPKKSPTQSPATPLANNRTRTNSKPSWTSWSKRPWTSKCSRLARSRWPINSTVYQPQPTERVSFPPIASLRR